MVKYIIRRLLISIPVLLGITMIAFAVYNLAPGDPISAMIDPAVPVPPEVLEKMKEDLGLNKPVYIIEWIFSWPGMGQLAISSVNMRDYPTLMGIALIGSTLVLLSNLLADILYALADPRIRYA